MKAQKPQGKDFLKPAPENYNWPRVPEAEKFIDEALEAFFAVHSFARNLSDRLMTETSTRFVVWTDHVILPARRIPAKRLLALGFWEDKKSKRPSGFKVFYHPLADLPRILVSSSVKEVGAAIKVENLWHFQFMNGFSIPIEGNPYSPYRRFKISDGNSNLFVIERRGAQGYEPDKKDMAEKYLRCFERLVTRPRLFKSETDGMNKTLALAKDVVREIGSGPASWAFLEAERIYWQGRNRAGHIQKSRQDKLGMGWANHDHHTFRSSRAQFSFLIQILLTFGFKKRERFYAGAEAGWGAQVMEQPEAGTVIFADVDLAPEDVKIDFSKKKMMDLSKPRTVGLWCALHGESILQAGMHHLEAKFDFEQLKFDLKERQIETMPPFSDFEFLRQAFTKAEMWRVNENRLNSLLASKKISEEAAQKIKTDGAVGSHLENLQRREGFKGFNQRGVSDIITAVNPEKQALHSSSESRGA